MTHTTEIRSEALGYLYERYYKDHPERLASLEREMINVEVAQCLYDLRGETGLSLEEFAESVRVEPSVIEDLEEADYEGDSIAMLTRIASALGKIVQLRWIESGAERETSTDSGYPKVEVVNA
jgi:ribosome-binding protein aMBF1 (putative translation factor)